MGLSTRRDVMTGNEYRIETIEDFSKVPTDRLEDCLREVAAVILHCRSGLAEHSYHPVSVTWIDDGVLGYRGITLRSDGGDIHIGKA